MTRIEAGVWQMQVRVYVSKNVCTYVYMRVRGRDVWQFYKYYLCKYNTSTQHSLYYEYCAVIRVLTTIWKRAAYVKTGTQFKPKRIGTDATLHCERRMTGKRLDEQCGSDTGDVTNTELTNRYEIVLSTWTQIGTQ